MVFEVLGIIFCTGFPWVILIQVTHIESAKMPVRKFQAKRRQERINAWAPDQ